MTTAVLFLILTLVFLSFTIYFLDLYLFVKRVEKVGVSQSGEEAYFAKMEAAYGKEKNKRKKNFYLFCLIQEKKRLGKEEDARVLLPFLKDDPILGIKKEA